MPISWISDHTEIRRLTRTSIEPWNESTSHGGWPMWPLGEVCLGMGCEEVWRVIVGWDGNLSDLLMFFVHVFFPTKIGVDSPWGVDLGDSFGAWVLDADMVFQLPIGSLRTVGPALHWGELGKSKVSELFVRLSRDSHGDRGRHCP